MIKWLSFAFKNVLRNRRRALITILIAAIGSASLMVSGGYGMFTYSALEEMTSKETGHIVIAHSQYFDDTEESPMQFGLANHLSLSSDLKQNSDIQYIVPRLNFSGLISNGDKSEIFLGTGVDPAVEFYVNGPFMQLVSGRRLSQNPSPDTDPEIFLGVKLASQLNATVGTVLTILGTTTEGGLNGFDVKVRGIISTGKPEMDARKVLLPLNIAQEMILTDKISTLSVYLKDRNNTDTTLTTLEKIYPGNTFRSWPQLAHYYHKVRGLYDRIFGIMGIIIISIVFFAVSNTLTMTVAERTREIGTLRAMGTLPGQLINVFILEAIIISLLGALLGVLITAAISTSLVFFPVMMPPPPGMTMEYPLSIVFSPFIITLATISLVVVSILAAWFAAHKGAKKPIVEALGHV